MAVELLAPEVILSPPSAAKFRLPLVEDRSSRIVDGPESSVTEKPGITLVVFSIIEKAVGLITLGASFAPFTRI